MSPTATILGAPRVVEVEEVVVEVDVVVVVVSLVVVQPVTANRIMLMDNNLRIDFILLPPYESLAQDKPFNKLRASATILY